MLGNAYARRLRRHVKVYTYKIAYIMPFYRKRAYFQVLALDVKGPNHSPNKGASASNEFHVLNELP